MKIGTICHKNRTGKINQITPMQKHQKILNPLVSQNLLQQGYATDSIFPEVNSFEGYNCAQGFTSIYSGYRAVHGMVSESNKPKDMFDLFCRYRLPISLVIDNSKI